MIPDSMHRYFRHMVFAITECLACFVLLAGCGVRDRGGREGSRADLPELETHVRNLDDMLMENSGLILHGGRLWTINDSGGDPILFSMDIQTGKALQAIRVANGDNVDWESLAQDEEYIYICDMGNNFGRRNSLVVYRIPKDSIPSSGNASVHADIIEYRYRGMERSEQAFHRSRFDGEAAFVFGDSLYLFTKDWENMSTTLYTCSTQPGSYILDPRRTYDIDGLVTGADISPDGRYFVLCGYRDYVPFVWLFQDFNPSDYSCRNALRIDFPAFLNLQTEGIAFESPERVFISSEMSDFPASLYRLDLRSCVK